MTAKPSASKTSASGATISGEICSIIPFEINKSTFLFSKRALCMSVFAILILFFAYV